MAKFLDAKYMETVIDEMTPEQMKDALKIMMRNYKNPVSIHYALSEAIEGFHDAFGNEI